MEAATQPEAEAASSSAAAVEPTEAHVAALLEKLATYVEGEATVSAMDFELLRAMNQTAAERYNGMAEDSAGLVAFAERLQAKCEALSPQLAQVCGSRIAPPFPLVLTVWPTARVQIDVLESQVAELESAVEQLDSYSKRLESKFTALAS